MILPGKAALSRAIIHHTINLTTQIQPCGVDLTLKRVLSWTSAGSIDFDNTRRKLAETQVLPFQAPIEDSTEHDSPKSQMPDQAKEPNTGGFIDLPAGAYLVEFNETIAMPLDVMGEVFVRSSLFRSGALLSGGVMDSGYTGAIGALLQVVNPHGLRVWKDARLGQMVMHEMAEKTDGYQGMYQGRKEM
jgi:dUTP pyrophosphatase